MSELRIDELQPRKKWTAEDVRKMSAEEVAALGLTPEELEEIFGAGRPGVQLGIESLEAREMMDAGLGNALSPLIAPTRPDAPQVGHVRELSADLAHATPVMQIQAGPAVFDTLAGTLGGGATGAHGAGPLNTSALDSFFSTAQGGGSIQENMNPPATTPAENVIVQPVAHTLKTEIGDIKLPQGVTPVSGQVKWGEWSLSEGWYHRSGIGANSIKVDEKVNDVGTDFSRTTTQQNNARTVERWYMSGNDTLTSFEAFTSTNARVAFGRYEGGVYTFETLDGYRPGVSHSTEIYDKAPQSGGKLQSLDATHIDGTTVHGEWQDSKWTETTTDAGGIKLRFAVYQTAGANGTGVGLLSFEDYADGRLARKQVNHPDGSSVTENFNTHGNVTRRQSIAADKSSVTESFDVSGNLIQRANIQADGLSVAESFGSQGKVTRRATIAADHKSSVTESFDAQGNLTRKETGHADGSSVTETLNQGKVTRRETIAADHISLVIESFDAQGALTQKATNNAAGTMVVESYLADGKSVSKRTTIKADGSSRTEDYDQHGNKVTVFEGHASAQGWVEEQWVVGCYTKTIWATRDHKANDSPIMQVVIQGTKMTATRFNVPSNYWWHAGEYSTNSATLTWVYAFKSGDHPDYGQFSWADEKDEYGRLEYHYKVFQSGDLTDFVIAAPDGTTNHWYKETGWDTWIRGYWETPDHREVSQYGRWVDSNLATMRLLSTEIVGELNVHGGGI